MCIGINWFTDLVVCHVQFDVQLDEAVENAQLLAVLNAGGVFPVGPQYPLKLEEKAGGAAYIELPKFCSAAFAQAVNSFLSSYSATPPLRIPCKNSFLIRPWYK